MTPLNKVQVAGLTGMIAATVDEEIDCSGCASRVAEFIERQMAGQPMDGILTKVEQHLQICPECTEEFQTMKRIVESES